MNKHDSQGLNKGLKVGNLEEDKNKIIIHCSHVENSFSFLKLIKEEQIILHPWGHSHHTSQRAFVQSHCTAAVSAYANTKMSLCPTHFMSLGSN